MAREPAQEIGDDPELLALLLADLAAAPSAYQPTAYWAGYLQDLARFLRDKGLTRFRANRSVFAKFGASDSAFYEYPELVLGGGWADLETRQAVARALPVFERHPHQRILPFGVSASDLLDVAMTACRMYGRLRGVAAIDLVSASLAGGPTHHFVIDGRPYTLGFLDAYWRYAHCAGLVDFASIRSFVELGTGSGKQIEVVRKLHPGIACYALDLPPPIYVCGQYLKAVFPGSAVDYRGMRGRKSIRASAPGEILLLGNWQLPDIDPEPPVLFWNAASFGEMSPAVVANYLAVAGRFSDWIYLLQSGEGKAGSTEPMPFASYVEWLAPSFELVDRAPARRPLGLFAEGGDVYHEAIWRRRPG